VEKTKQEIAKTERDRLQKIVEELHESKEECFSTDVQRCEKLKNMFINIGAFFSEEFVYGCNALNLGVEFFSSFLSPNSGVTLFSLPDSLFLPNFKPV
jgi:hypothetical protein